MIGIAVFLIALFAMFGWFGYLVVKDPSNLFKRRPPPGGDGRPPV